MAPFQNLHSLKRYERDVTLRGLLHDTGAAFILA